MKRKIFYMGALFLMAVSFHSCDAIKDNCKQCRYNVYVDGSFSYSEFEAEYCGTDLITRQAAPDVVVDNTVTKFECDN